MTALLTHGATMLLTYATHSLLACVLALIAARSLHAPQERDMLWKVALVAPLVTTLVAIVAPGLRGTPFRVELADLVRRSPLLQLPDPRLIVRVLDDGIRREEFRRLIDPVTTMLSVLAVSVTGLCSAVAGVRLVTRRRILARALRARHHVAGIRDGVRLSSSDTLQSPVALFPREICLPTFVLRDFSAQHCETLVAHESAHLRRRDPSWFALVDVICACSAYQPLVFVVARSFRCDVELICDEAAVRATGSRTALIGALALLASPFDAISPLHGAPAAYNGSPLVARATRIARLSLDERPAGLRNAMFAACVLAAALVVAPVVSTVPRIDPVPADLSRMTSRARSEGRLVTVDSTVTEGRMSVRVLVH